MDLAELERLVTLLDKYAAYHAAYRPVFTLSSTEDTRRYMEWAKELYHLDFTLRMVRHSHDSHKDQN